MYMQICRCIYIYTYIHRATCNASTCTYALHRRRSTTGLPRALQEDVRRLNSNPPGQGVYLLPMFKGALHA